MDPLCGACAKVFNPTSLTIVPCNGPCRKRFHSACAGFSNLTAVQISFLLWFCEPCQRGGLRLPRSELIRVVQDLCRGEDPEKVVEGGNAGCLELPVEVLEIMFQYLNFRQLGQVRRTCHRWKAVVDGSVILRRKFCVCFPAAIMMDSDYVPEYLFPNPVAKIREARIVTVDTWWPSLGEVLVELHMDDCVIALHQLGTMLRQTPNIKTVHLNNVYCPDTCDVSSVANFQLKQMQELYLIDVSPFVCDLLEKVCTGLKSFHCMEQDLSTLEALPVADESIESIEKWQTTLTSLQITPSESTLPALNHLKELQLKSISMNCHLTPLDQVISFIQHQRNLTRVALYGIPLTDSTLRNVGRILPGLEELTLEKYRDDVWNMTFLNSMPKLKAFRVFKASNPFQEEDSEPCANFLGCRSPKLQEIEFHGVEPLEWDDMYEFLKAAPNLHTVTLGSYRIASWSTLFETLPLTKLRSLSLSSIALTTDSSHDSLVEYLENLRCLNLEDVALLEDELETLFRLCPRLENVSLRKLDKLDDGVMLVLCQKLNHLAELSIAECPITDASFTHIVNHCFALEHLKVESCVLVTENSYVQIVESNRNGRFDATKFLFNNCEIFDDA